MADRSVTVRLDADVKPFIAAMAKAEAAAKKFRDGLGGGNAPDPFEPYDREQQKRKKQAPKEGDEIAGAFARAFSKRLDAAFKSLPKVKVDADSTEAQSKLQDVRSSLAALSGKRIGIDLDAATALGEVESLKAELDKLSESTDIDIRADATAALMQLDALQRDIYKLAESNPTVTPNADTTEAQARIAELRASLDELQQRRRLGVDLDDGAARTAIASIQSELERLNATSADPKVRLDSAAALTELRAVQAEMSRVSGQSARVNVDADVSGALSAIALVGAALASLPAVTSIAVAVGALGGAFAAAGAGAAGFAAVAVPSMGRINEALKQQESAAGGAGGATKSAGQSAAEAASRALQLEQAERRVTDAQKGVKAAQEDLTRARRDAIRANQDLALSVRDAALSEEDAALSVEEAARRLAEVQADPESTDLEIRRAELSHRMAMQRLDEQQVRTKRLKEDKAEADKKGVEGSDQVRGAQEKLLKAQTDLSDAQKQLTVLQLQQKAAMEKTGGAAGGAASKMAELSKAERALAKDVKAFQDSYIKWQRSLQPDVFPAIRSGMDLMSTGMRLSTPLVKASAGAFDDFLKQANRELKSEQWKSFFRDLTEQAPRAIDGLGDSALNVAGGLAGIVQAFLPFTDTLMDRLEDITQEFEDWGQNLKGSPEFDAFIDYVSKQGPKVADVLGNIAKFVGTIMSVGAGAAPAVLDFLVVLSDKLAGMEPEQIQAIALGVGAIFAAAKIGASIKLGAIVLLADVLAKMSPGQIQALALAIAGVVVAVKGYQAVSGVVGFFQGLSGSLDKAGKSAAGAKGPLGGLSGLFKGGVIATAVVGYAAAFDKVNDAIRGLAPDLDKVAKGLDSIGKGGAPTVELFDQLKPKLNTLTGDFETFGDTAERLASDNPLKSIVTDIGGFIDSVSGIQLDDGKQAIDNIDKALADMVSNGNVQGAALAFDKLAKQAMDAGVPIDKLKDLFPEYASSMDGLPATTGEVGHAIGLLGGKADETQRALGEAQKRMDDFKSSLDEFNGQTDAAQAVREMERAYKDVKTAISDANGKLELTPGLTGKQRDAVILARDAFSGYLEKVRLSSDAQGTLTGRTTDARDALLKQLPALSDLAGKNQSARDQVLQLAKAYGISEEDAKKAARGGKDLIEVLGKLKSKDIRVGVDTKPAEAGLESFLKRYGNRSLAIAIQSKVTAAGALRTRDGVELMAAGGFMGAGAAGPPPNVATRPTFNASTSTLYGEAGREAYIPYDGKYRSRALAILSQVASDFGLQVYGEQATRQVSDMQVTISDTGVELADGLTSTVNALVSTMGQAGSLTSSITRVGATAEQLKDGWVAGSQVLSNSVTLTGRSVTGWGEVVSVSVADMSTKVSTQVGGLGKEVVSLGDVIAKAVDVVRSVAAAKSKAAGGSSSKSSPTGSKGAIIGGPGPKKTPTGSAGAVIGYVPSPEAAPAPLNPHSSGISGGSAGSSGWNTPTNSSRVSAPQQAHSGGYVPPSAEGGAAAGGGAAPTVVNNRTVTFPDLVVRESADAQVLFAQASMHLGGRG